VQRLLLLILATQETEIERIKIQSQPWEKSSQDLISINKQGMMTCACHTRYGRKHKRRIISINARPYLKNM
jgi:hypothetical protein